MTIYLDVDGVPTRISDCVWAGIAPCGCVNSSLRAGSDPLNPVLTADDARKRWAHGSRRKDPDTYVLYSQDTFPWGAFDGKCPHTPKWGRR